MKGSKTRERRRKNAAATAAVSAGEGTRVQGGAGKERKGKAAALRHT